MTQAELPRVKKSFQWAIERNLLRFVVKKMQDGGFWLTVEYSEPNDFTPSESGYTWKILCAQPLRDYKTREHLVNRITLMLADKVQSATQDVNGLMADYDMVRKVKA